MYKINLLSFPVLDLAKLFDFDYLLEPEPQTFSFAGFLVLFLLIILLVSVVTKVLIKKKYVDIIGARKVIIKKWSTYNIIAAVIGLVLAFIRLQGFTYLSMRIIQLLFVLVFVVFNLVLLYKYLSAPKVEKQKEKLASGLKDYQKYLPKKKRKR